MLETLYMSGRFKDFVWKGIFKTFSKNATKKLCRNIYIELTYLNLGVPFIVLCAHAQSGDNLRSFEASFRISMSNNFGQNLDNFATVKLTKPLPIVQN